MRKRPVSFAGGPTQFTTSAAVSFCANPGDPGTVPSGCSNVFRRTDATGRVSLPVTSTASGLARYLVCEVVHSGDFLSLFVSLVSRKPCRSSSGGVVVTPSQTTIAPGASRQFTVVVEETPDQEVTWAVQNGAGGTIAETGLFTSNGALGTFFVTATSVANPDSVGIAQVTVAEPTPPSPPTGGLPCTDGCLFEGTHQVCASGECRVDPSSPDRIVFLDSDDTLAGGPGRLVHLGLAINGGPTRTIQFAITVQPGGAFAGVGSCAGVEITVQGTVSVTSLAYDTLRLPIGLLQEKFEGARFVAADASSREKR